MECFYYTMINNDETKLKHLVNYKTKLNLQVYIYSLSHSLHIFLLQICIYSLILSLLGFLLKMFFFSTVYLNTTKILSKSQVANIMFPENLDIHLKPFSKHSNLVLQFILNLFHILKNIKLFEPSHELISSILVTTDSTLVSAYMTFLVGSLF